MIWQVLRMTRFALECVQAGGRRVIIIRAPRIDGGVSWQRAALLTTSRRRSRDVAACLAFVYLSATAVSLSLDIQFSARCVYLMPDLY